MCVSISRCLCIWMATFVVRFCTLSIGYWCISTTDLSSIWWVFAIRIKVPPNSETYTLSLCRMTICTYISFIRKQDKKKDRFLWHHTRLSLSLCIKFQSILWLLFKLAKEDWLRWLWKRNRGSRNSPYRHEWTSSIIIVWRINIRSAVFFLFLRLSNRRREESRYNIIPIFFIYLLYIFLYQYVEFLDFYSSIEK